MKTLFILTVIFLVACSSVAAVQKKKKLLTTIKELLEKIDGKILVLTIHHNSRSIDNNPKIEN